ncbi:NADH-quinone oxidoreductase subunit G [Gordonia effusa NBRC 100432]|uniref:NADH-quinone oxidoreductase n=1 Tax=Gordonia effusa NBRC 100432 TaxID=1077974 RepID=H0R524_9ACTN|nr:NADH-quinone oxidoreductase subunit G [Gordonia effusa]GAB20175.1 NADH-quinone oxidoreductase subunit G [Gordonia effusa NBRC 100432]
MTTTNAISTTPQVPDDLVTATIDGTEVSVPKGTLVIRAAELIGVDIPRFCDHPLLAPVGACRQCLVEVEGQRKPMASCTITVTDGMVVHTQHSSPDAASAQRGVMELLLINHPLDCPTCDKGGECPLQNQAMSAGRPQSRFAETKRTFTKPVPLSSEVLLDRERCVLCARCTRFSDEIAGDPLIALADRGALQQVSAYADEPFESYFSGNTVQICPVGALTGAAYRFRARPFDLVSSPSVCEHCASGCAQRTDHRRGKVMRRLAGDDPEVNEEWNCDKGRWAFAYAASPARITTPLARDRTGELRPVSWAFALTAAARGLRTGGPAGVLVGGRATVEDAYTYGKFARVVLGTNDVDFRIRAHSAEESEFLAAYVAGSGISTTYHELAQAPVVVLAGFEAEEESPMVFLRLRKAVRLHGQRVYSIASWASPGLTKLSGELISTAPGNEAEALDAPSTRGLLAAPGSVLIVGERLAASPGALSAAANVVAQTGARLVWIPRRAGERGAADVGAAPMVLPGGRPVSSEHARRDIGAVWGVRPPATPGRDTDAIIDAVRRKELSALVVGGVEADDLPTPTALTTALASADFVVSLEQRHSLVTARADVVFPVASVAEKSGTFVDWEGRPRSFTAALDSTDETLPLSDHRVLNALAAELGIDLNCDTGESIHTELHRIGSWDGERHSMSLLAARPRPALEPGQATLASWRMLLDAGLLQDGEPHLAGTAHRSVARLNARTAAEIEVADGDPVSISTMRGSITLPLTITDMPDRVVWIPMNSANSRPYPTLGAAVGSVVSIGGGRR